MPFPVHTGTESRTGQNPPSSSVCRPFKVKSTRYFRNKISIKFAFFFSIQPPAQQEDVVGLELSPASTF